MQRAGREPGFNNKINEIQEIGPGNRESADADCCGTRRKAVNQNHAAAETVRRAAEHLVPDWTDEASSEAVGLLFKAYLEISEGDGSCNPRRPRKGGQAARSDRGGRKP